MAKNTYAIMGATGQIGHIIADDLLAQGHIVHAIGRDKAKLKKLQDKGAVVFTSDFDDSEGLAKAFHGCHAVFCFLPPAYTAEDYDAYGNKVGEAILHALIKENITHIVFLSSVGAHLSEGTGPIKMLHKQEKRLNSIPNINVVHFRPGGFMENLFDGIPSIKKTGKNSSPLRADIGIPMISTVDIGHKIAGILSSLKFKGISVFEFLGPETETLVEISLILGKAIGKPDLKYEYINPYAAEKAFLASGMTQKTTNLMLEMYKAMNEGKILPTQPITSDHRGTTTYEKFAETFSQAYNRKSSASNI